DADDSVVVVAGIGVVRVVVVGIVVVGLVTRCSVRFSAGLGAVGSVLLATAATAPAAPPRVGRTIALLVVVAVAVAVAVEVVVIVGIRCVLGHTRLRASLDR